MRDLSTQDRKRKKSLLIWPWWISFLFIFNILATPVLANQKSKQTAEKKRIPSAELEKYNDLTGSEIMAKVFRRHETFPYVYEEQTMILTDHTGNKDVRKVKRYFRAETANTMKTLLVFNYPSEVKGLALRFIRDHNGLVKNQIYLPALGKALSLDIESGHSSYLLGTDFALEDLLESLPDFQYTRISDQTIDKVPHFVVEAYPPNNRPIQTGYSKRRLFVRQDIFFIVRTDYFNHDNQLFKQLTRHDLKKVDKVMWRADMLLMENRERQHTTLIKINRRVFSQDYVRAVIFNPSWLLKNPKDNGIQNLATDKTINTDDNNIGN